MEDGTLKMYSEPTFWDERSFDASEGVAGGFGQFACCLHRCMNGRSGFRSGAEFPTLHVFESNGR